MAIVVRISDDGMEAVVDMELQPGETADAEAIQRALAAAGVVHGIDAATCEGISGNSPSVPSFIVARGQAPIHGEDGRIELAVEFHHSDVGMPASHGNIDFHERGSFTPIDKGQIIARIVPATAGTPGKTVRGAVLAAKPGNRARVPSGKNLKLEADGTELRSAIAGDLRIKGDAIEVMDMIRVSGNVDFQFGSIECEGPVRVEGDVLPGFHIRAGGDVWIGGLVEGAEVASRGNVTVVQGVLGNSRIHATGRIAVGYSRESHLESDGSVTIARECVNSTIVSGDTIGIPEEGRVIGGHLLAKNTIEAGSVNFTHGAHTILAVGPNPHADLTACRIHIKKEIHPGVIIRFGESELTVRADAKKAAFLYDAESDQIVQT